ncbi:MAG: ASKHA domain-containing protein [Desulfovibrio sp.]|jgi:uncharacterized 2Fe-2S/4Fe-4S cluster protein (DUF4445 family)|nr:ASKHA domain-containing protein [Desulfovibrio sp.]
MPSVRFFPQGVVAAVPPGTALLEAAGAAGLSMETPCGGNGTCGKCLVRVLTGPPPVAQDCAKPVPPLLILACQSIVGEDDLDLEIQAVGENSLQIHDSSLDVSFRHAPRLSKRFLPDLGQTEVLAGGKTLCLEAGNSTDSLFGLAVDVGTTTLAVALVDLRNGEETASASTLNRQTRHAHDVLGRVSFAAEPGGLAILQQDLLADLNALTAEVCGQAGISGADVYEAVICGNTCMQHLAAGIDPANLGRRPYHPAFRGHAYRKAAEIGLRIASGGEIYFPAVLSGHVGADIVAGIVATGLLRRRRPTLFIDIGTNGEMVLAKEGRAIAASTAAGPAFEGMNISCGMRAAAGAIEAYSLKGDGRPALKTIAAAPPRGLCGSGLIDAVAAFVIHNGIAPSGRFAPDGGAVAHLLERANGKSRLRLAPGVFLTQKDIRQVQLAKAAIRAGIDLLLRQARILPEQVDGVLIAGSFGYHLKERSLLDLGLLPEAFAGKTEFVGNTSKAGARIFLLDASSRDWAASLAEKASCLDLAELPEFQDVFTASMAFPRAHAPAPEAAPAA